MAKRRRRRGLHGLSCSGSKYSLSRVPLNSGGYEYGRYGRYFGQGEPLYRYDDGGSDTGELRARSRADAKAQLRQRCPGIRFYR